MIVTSFGVGTVFDVSQTEGYPLPEPPVAKEIRKSPDACAGLFTHLARYWIQRAYPCGTSAPQSRGQTQLTRGRDAGALPQWIVSAFHGTDNSGGTIMSTNTSVQSNINAVCEMTRSYDKAQELTSTTQGTSTHHSSYDADGDRTKVGTTPRGSDISSGTWNGAGELTAYSDCAATMSIAGYDGNGYRTSETTGSATESFVWDASGLLLMDSNYAFTHAPDGSPLEQVSFGTGHRASCS